MFLNLFTHVPDNDRCFRDPFTGDLVEDMGKDGLSGNVQQHLRKFKCMGTESATNSADRNYRTHAVETTFCVNV